jgi:hypothetical protein
MTWGGVGASGQFKTVNHGSGIFRGDYEEARGDVSGVIDNLVVIRLQGRPMSPLAPVSGNLLAWTGSSWVPSDVSVLISGILNHNLLSPIHPDTAPASPVANDLIAATTGAPPIWARFPRGTNPYEALSVNDSLDLVWRDPNVIPPLIVTSGAIVNLANENRRVVVAKPSGSPTTVNLPTSPILGQEVVIKDGKGDANMNNIDILPASGTTIDSFSVIRLKIKYGAYTMMWNGMEWNII